MKVNISSKWLLLSINHDSQYVHIVNKFVTQSFKKTIKLSDTTIIFHDDSELRKKKQLLFWISNIYAKVNKNTLPSFLKSITRAEGLHLKIKIINTQKNLSPNITLMIKRYSNRELVAIKSSLAIGKTITHFLKLFFNGYKVIDIVGYDIGIYIDNDRAKEKLRELVNRNKILQFKIECKYDFYVKSIITNTQNFQREYRKKIDEDAPIKLDLELKRAFLLLGSSQNEEFGIVKKKYLKLAKKYHPDSVFDKSTEVIEFHTKKFQEIQEAFASVKLHFKSS